MNKLIKHMWCCAHYFTAEDASVVSTIFVFDNVIVGHMSLDADAFSFVVESSI